MSQIKFSIVTVNYNNQSGLERTIASSLSQDYEHFEMIIIDGLSSDGSRSILKEINDNRVSFLSEKDNGIYDGMNKGLNLCCGDWVIFMNSGDVFFDASVLANVAKQSATHDSEIQLIYGNKSYRGRTLVPLNIQDEVSAGGMFACHQAMFFRSDVKYNLKFRIYADYDLIARIYKNYGADAFAYVPITICLREDGGVSSIASYQKRKDKYLSLFENFGLKGVLKGIFTRLLT